MRTAYRLFVKMPRPSSNAYTIQHVFEWFDVYGAVAPTTGERFCLELPYLDAETFQLFANAFAETSLDSLNSLLLENSCAHTAQQLR